MTSPSDLTTIANILRDMGVQSVDPLVNEQLLEFVYHYTTSVLRDAQFYQAHRDGAKLELEDARLAIQSRVNCSFTQPPPRELMLELAAERNAQPLDVVPKSVALVVLGFVVFD